MVTPFDKRRFVQQTKRQLGFNAATSLIAQLTDMANGARLLIDKGRAGDARTRQIVQLRCSPADIQKALSPEQTEKIRKFIADFAEQDKPTEKPLAKKTTPRKR